ncbi:MAG: CBS domain-containing protein, partial [Candidatus Diapherotrites archaeon]
MEHILVSDLMTREPITAKLDTNLLECARKMVKKKTGSLLLVDKNKLVGIVSRHDILWALIKQSKSNLESIKAIDISPKKILTIKPSATLDEAIKKMKMSKFERLPVIDNNKLVGIITVKDILNFHPEVYPELEEFARIREESKKLRLIEKAREKESIGEGICEECGNQDILYKFNGMLVCES